MENPQLFRLRAERSGREIVRPVEPGVIYVDESTDEDYEVRSAVLPLEGSGSRLLRTPENLRACTRCGELVGRDLNDCSECGRRLDPLGDN